MVRTLYPQPLYNKHNPEHPDFPEFINFTEIGGLSRPNLDILRYGEANRLFRVRTNSQGFRSDYDFSLQKNPKKRILFFGDSVMFGDGLDQDQALPAVIERMNPDVESYNFGVAAFSLGQAYLLFRQNLNYKPDVVIVSIFTNDIINEFPNNNRYGNPFFVFNGTSLILYRYPSVYNEEELNNAREQHKVYKYSGHDRMLRSYSHLYVLLCKIFNSKSNQKYPDAKFHPRYQYYLKQPSPEIQNSVLTLCALANEFKVQTDKINSTLVFMYVPDPVEIDPEERINAINADALHYDPNDFDFGIIASYFNTCFRNQNISYVDIYSLFVNEPNPKLLYNHLGSHWTPFGVTKVAEKLQTLI
ncbi:TPA: hypothetical protein HA235_06695 [Candidatus Woesearchaeota archaeon]|nr:SGNH/GDSL hydrolase family protein [Candidatus Woesearchaeota archaeon]HIH32365.1 hypothetical protein [Candidatus Woesearchaeota archaeon]HIH54536.1 hypothetical protein [Candidatus Woesearchaeota archaeon]HIJ02242.1 hypothetical protein [Candidatus Woesearchaeota archaeon]HIJ14301.1 hypothetical protein [Candidatus Woesearchaeota archaeon]